SLRDSFTARGSGQSCMREALRQKLPLRHRPDIAPVLSELANDGWLEPRVHEAIPAALVLTLLPVIPIDAPPELVPRRIVLVADQIAGALPTEWRASDVSPGSARIVAPAGRELQEERRVVDGVLLRKREDLGEFLVDLSAEHEMVALELLVVVAG